MATDNKQNLRNFKLVRGGMYGTKRRTKSRLRFRYPRAELIQLDGRKHLAYLRLADNEGNVPSEGIQNVREGKTHPWRAEGRRYIEMKASGVALEDAIAVAMETVLWVMDMYGVRQALPHDPNQRIAIVRALKAA